MSALAGSSPPESSRDLRRARETRTKIWRVSVVTIFFIVVLGANLFVGATLMVKAMRARTEEAEAARIGRVTYPMLDGVFCRHVLFDNKTVQTKEDKVSRCDEDRAAKPARHTTTFNWGGR